LGFGGRAIRLAMAASARHLLDEIEAYYLLPRSGGRRRVTMERGIPGYFPVTRFDSRFRHGKIPGSMSAK